LNDTAVLGISIDAIPSNTEFANKIAVKFPLLSDMKREVLKQYGILNDDAQFANRTSFVVDKQGRIQQITEGSGAIDPTNAIDLCTDLKRKG
jgi:peroxiredoxin